MSSSTPKKAPKANMDDVHAALQALITQAKKDGMIRASDLNAQLENMQLTPEQIEYMMHWMYDEASLRCQMTKEGHVYFIIHVEGEPAGYVSVRPEDAGVFHLEKIYVLPDFQGCHCGSALFRHAVAYVRRVCPEARAIELNVNRQNPALGFYRRMGMRIDREGDFDIGSEFYMNDYIMGLDI